jgi:hypothetical protein
VPLALNDNIPIIVKELQIIEADNCCDIKDTINVYVSENWDYLTDIRSFEYSGKCYDYRGGFHEKRPELRLFTQVILIVTSVLPQKVLTMFLF